MSGPFLATAHISVTVNTAGQTREPYSSRMYQNTFQPTFEHLPKEAIEHHIKGAEKYWDKFLEQHNELYNRCDTVEQIEAHRVVHRNT